MQLNPKQQYSFEQAMRGKNVFISGPGGVGKSVVVRKIRDAMDGRCVVLAPTGIAALNIEGSTFHRTFLFPFGYLDPYRRNKISDKAKNLFSDDEVTTIIVDEISMVRADLFTALDNQLKKIKRRRAPFGGMQIIIVGDFFQLPPVLNANSKEGKLYSEEFKDLFAFSTDAWREAGLETIELTQVMRQSDVNMINALNSIRVKDTNYKQALKFLNSIGASNDSIGEDTIFLCATNKDADFINKESYDALDSEEKHYVSKVTGQFQDFPVPEYLSLKVGTKVLLCANSSTFVNGQTGVVSRMLNDSVSVILDRNNEEVLVSTHKWQAFDYTKTEGGVKQEEIGTFEQLPIKLGYAATIHKSQGLSLDNAIIYTGRGCFSHGQAYVALSRLRSLEGLGMLKEIRTDEIIVDPKVSKFYQDNQYSNLINS